MVFVTKYKADIRLYTQTRQAWASAEIFPLVGKVDILLVHFRLLKIQCKRTFT